jgi:ArsR family transcriptional regulator
MKTLESRVRVERMFRALSDRTRLRILHLLQQREICVCDLVGVLRVPQPTASRHLAYLRRAGLVIARREGQWCYYRLAEPTNEFHERVLACLTACSEVVPQLGRDGERLERNGCGAESCPT